jgi:hypothetical protein
MELRSGGDGTVWFYLAMAAWQMGDKRKARKWYDEAVRWMDQPDEDKFYRDPTRQTDEIRCLRAEAAELLAVKAPPAELLPPPKASDDRALNP